MAFKCREELVGKRFLCVRSSGKLKLNKILDWEWRSGVVRAVSGRDTANVEFSALVEFDDRDWQKREWVRIHEVFQLFLIEHTLVWAEREDPNNASENIYWPGLNFKPVVDKVLLSSSRRKPVEFLVDRFLGLVEDKTLKIYQEGDDKKHATVLKYPNVGLGIKEWIDYQDGQKILLTTPTVLVGYRLEVYRAEGTTQWYTAVIQSYNHTTKTLAVTDDTVLEEHNEDPGLIQMRLIDDGVVDSILRGVEIGIGPRRTRQTNKDKDQSSNSSYKTTQASSSTTTSASSSTGHPRSSTHRLTVSNTNTSVTSGSRSTPQRTVVSAKSSRQAALTSKESSPASPLSDNSEKDKGSVKRVHRDKKRKSEPTKPESEDVNSVLQSVSNDNSKVIEGKNSTQVESNKCGLSPAVKKPKKHPDSDISDLSVPSSELSHSTIKSSKAEERKQDISSKKCDNKVTDRLQTSKRSKGPQVENSGENRKFRSRSAKTPTKQEENCSTLPRDNCKDKEALVERKPSPLSYSLSDSQGQTGTQKEVPDCGDSKRNSVFKCDSDRACGIDIPQDSTKSSLSSAENKTKNDLNTSGDSVKDTSGAEACESSEKSIICDNKPNKGCSLKSIEAVSDSGKVKGHSCEENTDDNMHLLKQRLLACNNASESGSKPSTSTLAGIDVNRSLTDQITKLNRSSEVIHGNLSSVSEAKLPLPNTSLHNELTSKSTYSHSVVPENVTQSGQNTSYSSSSEIRSSSRTSDHSSTYSDRPSSRVDDLKGTAKNSPATSPLVVDKGEPVLPYRDPELMRKNPVQSSVQNMLGSHKTSQVYPSVHNPIPTGPSPTLPTTSSYHSRQPHVLPYHLGPSALAMGLPPTVDPASLAIIQQQRLALQFNNSLLMGHPALSMAQLEVLWQQKYPTVPVPPSWLLANKQEELVRDLCRRGERDYEREQLERERIDRIEREKERERQIERDRQLERERIEREQLEREKIEREKRERERLEREREIEQERRQHEREKRKERERILQESANTMAAVDDHFTQSFLMAQQKGASGWPPSRSITQGIGKIPEKPQPMAQDFRKEKMESKDDKVHLKEELLQQELLRRQEMYRQDSIKALSDQKLEQKPDKAALARELKYSQSQNFKGYPPASTTSASQNFSLFGYQPFTHSYINPEQLHEKMNMDNKQGILAAREPSPKRPKSSVPPPLIKDMMGHGSVIVENKGKDGSKSASPRPAHSHYSNTTIPVPSSSPRPQPQPKPAHTPDRHNERPRSALSSSSPGVAHYQDFSNQSMDLSSSSSQMPFKALKQESKYIHGMPAHNVAAQPLDFRGKIKNNSQSNKSLPAGSVSAASIPNMHHFVSAAIAQPPVSLPASGAFTYSLIEQGLVPNPIYSQNTVKSAPSTNPEQKNSISSNSVSPNSQPGSGAGAKRKVNRDSSNQKRRKGESAQGGTGASGHSVPVTTPQIMTNHSPYTTSSTNTTISNVLSSTMTTSSSTNSISATLASMIAKSAASKTMDNSAGFINSFKHFVENAVQNAFLNDAEMNKPKSISNESNAIQDRISAAGKSSPAIFGDTPTATPPLCSTPSSLLSQPQRRRSDPSQVAVNEDNVSLAGSTSSLNSHTTLMETINRVANSQIDTDSDTLSAPSPPPHVKSENSPHKSGHPKLKKAWLQRHSDEDKELKNSSPIPPNENSQSSQKGEMLRNCYVNCSYISPSKEGGSRSPISALRINGNMKDELSNDESTTSASETETAQGTEQGGGKKRAKKRSNQNSKKVKQESGAESGENSIQPLQTSTPPQPLKQQQQQQQPQQQQQHQPPPKKKNKKTKGEKDAKTQPVKTKETGVNELEEKPGIKYEEAGSLVPSSSGKKDKKESNKTSSTKEEPMDTSSPVSDSLPPGGSTKPQESAANPSNRSEKDKKKQKRQAKEKEKEKEAELDEPPSPPPNKLPPPSIIPQSNNQQNGSSFNKPLVKASVATLKKTCAPFLQNGSCSEVTPKLMKCRECKMTPTQRSKKLPNIFCRFYAFRRLRYSQRGFLTIEGFSELSDAEIDDIEPWLPNFPVMEPRLNVETAKYIISKIGDIFCELVNQEKEACSWAGEEAKVAWKRAVTGVREMCDVCDTTLFNMHWVCHKCGFVVCLDCYKVKMLLQQQDEARDRGDDVAEDPNLEEEQRRWLTCSSSRQQHEIDKLMLTQIIPRDALWDLGRLIHDMRQKWTIPSKCSCAPSKFLQKNGMNQKCLQAYNHIPKKLTNGIGEDHKKGNKKQDPISINGNINSSLGDYSPDSSSPLRMLADVASMDSESSRDRSESPFNKRRSDKDKYGKSYNPITEPVSPCQDKAGNHGDCEGDKKNPTSCSTLRELLTKTAGPGKLKAQENNTNKKSKFKNMSNSSDDILGVIQSMVEKQTVTEKQMPCSSLPTKNQPVKLTHYVPRFGYSGMIAYDTPIMVHNLTETSVLYPDVPHSWLCDGRLLRLHDPKHKGNFKIFQEQMRKGQPVLVSGVDKYLNKHLWHPQCFCKDFGKHKNDLINTRNGCLIAGHPMATFWEGFEKYSERLVDDEGETLLLKLKDWPPGDDFSDLMPQHFEDLMQALPLPEYTHRQGKLNLASRLPDFFVRPDLGPKMYNAYGSAYFPREGTTNLHLDISDAVNVLVYVGIPEDAPGGRPAHEQTALKAIDDAGCDMITRRRVGEVNEIPGALWQIFDARDADKIRDFLNKVAKENGEKPEPNHDPIHDQSWYLDEKLRDRLYKEYGVLGYTIVQCLGDAIFIPAGAPHQVRNFHNCIKVAEDFVSPEHLHHCFSLTQEFRRLSDTHSNHEDKLQVKNIIYHAVKDALAVLNNADIDEEED